LRGATGVLEDGGQRINGPGVAVRRRVTSPRQGNYLR